MDKTCLFLYYFDMNINDCNFEILTSSPGILTTDWQWDYAPGTNKSLVLWLITKGKGTLIDAGKAYYLTPGSCFILRPNESHIGRHDKKNTLIVPWMMFQILTKDNQIYNPPLDFLPKYRFIREYDFLAKIINRSIESFNNNNHAEAIIWLEATVREILRYDKQNSLSGLELSQSRIINTICSKIQNNPEKRYYIEDFATEMHCTCDHFIRTFKRHKHMTPGNFIIKCRIERACQLLIISSYDIGQIADILGYKDQYFFSRQFKKVMGVTPKKFRHGN